MEIQGINVEKEEVQDFQRVFPNTQAAALLGKMIAKIEMKWEEVLHDNLAGNDRVRAAQGALNAMQELGEMAYRFSNVNLEGEDAKEEEDNEDERADTSL